MKSTCPKGWQMFGGYCYKPVFTTLPWSHARKYCQQLKSDADLPSIHSKAENDFIFSIMGPKANEWRVGWIGYWDQDGKKKWTWVDGHTYTTMPYANWNAGEPNYGNYKPNCAHQRYDGLWNDNRCSIKLPFMCKVG